MLIVREGFGGVYKAIGKILFFQRLRNA